MRLGVFADVHGNLPALEAVLADMRRRAVDAAVNLGDLVSGPLWPRETLAVLREGGVPALRGNHDRWVSEGGEGASDRHAIAALDAESIAWLGALPVRLEPAPGVLAFHACPEDDNAYLLEDVRDGRLVPAPAALVAARLGEVAAGLVLCAHSHLAGLRVLPDGRHVLNPGSVGCPAYADPTAPAHVSEAGSPVARYAVVEIAEGLLRAAEMIALPYDHEAAARRAEANGRPDWAHALRHGAMPG
ncbi:metallophosphoesterase family protein [Falsiroseomonas sp. HW251]|uniref:metallophosphoesterase family protein n=1 Tax=Falsiroseomonas sp. HW251 TaxID=3390998 RepID=UPI003D314D92